MTTFISESSKEERDFNAKKTKDGNDFMWLVCLSSLQRETAT